MCDLKKLLKDKIKLEVQIKEIEDKIKLILEERDELYEKEFKEKDELYEKEFKEKDELYEKEFKEKDELYEKEFKEKDEFKDLGYAVLEESIEEEPKIEGDVEELENELLDFKEINIDSDNDSDLELEKKNKTDEFIPIFEDPSNGFIVNDIPQCHGLENLSLLTNSARQNFSENYLNKNNPFL